MGVLWQKPIRFTWDNIYEVRLCCLTQNYTNNQSKIRKNASSAFWDKMQKKVLAKQNNAKKSASTIGKRLTECHGYAHIWPLAIKNCNKNENALTYHRLSENTSHNDL